MIIFDEVWKQRKGTNNQPSPFFSQFIQSYTKLNQTNTTHVSNQIFHSITQTVTATIMFIKKTNVNKHEQNIETYRSIEFMLSLLMTLNKIEKKMHKVAFNSTQKNNLKDTKLSDSGPKKAE